MIIVARSRRLRLALVPLVFAATAASAENTGGLCAGLPTHSELKAALTAARGEANGGLNLDMWGAVVNRDGIVCGVAFTGKDRGDQWPGSRLIAAEKAHTANAFSLPKLSVSTANLYFATQPSGSLFGLVESHPLDAAAAYGGKPTSFGQPNDPLLGRKVGGIVVFGGGLALYAKDGKLVGAIGVSGDTSCADHNIAWRARHSLGLDFVPGGVNARKTHADGVVYDIPAAGGASPSGWGHPSCSPEVVKIASELPPTSK